MEKSWQSGRVLYLDVAPDPDHVVDLVSLVAEEAWVSIDQTVVHCRKAGRAELPETKPVPKFGGVASRSRVAGCRAAKNDAGGKAVLGDSLIAALGYEVVDD